jgi:hypothetical protein
MGFIFSIVNLHAQKAFENWALSVDGGSYGPGITVATSLSSHLELKAGLNHLPYTHKINLEYDVSGILSNHPVLGGYNFMLNISDPNFNFTNFKTIVDYYPVKKGIFSLSAGFYTGNNSISAKGQLDINRFFVENPLLKEEYDGDIVFKFEDVVIKPNPDGSFEGKMILGSAIKPYLGLGLGRTMANNSIGFKLDLGVVYHGKYKFESDNILVNYVIDSHSSKFTDEYNIPDWAFICWPIINFSISYRFN